MYDPQVYGLLGAVLLVHLGTLAYVYLRRQRPGESAAAESDGAGADEGRVETPRRDARPAADRESDGTVVCTACGARNAADYRFCRACVADLSGGTPRDGSEAFSNAA